MNAHFFLMEPADCSTPWDLLGQPFGLLVLRGGILQPPLFGRGSLMVMKDGSAHIGHPSLKDLGILVGDRLFQAGQNAVVYERPRYAFSPADPGAYDMAIVNDAVVALKQGGGLEVPQAGFVLRSGEAVKGGTVSYTGMLWLGGTRRPSQEEVMVTAVEKSASYPWSTIMPVFFLNARVK